MSPEHRGAGRARARRRRLAGPRRPLSAAAIPATGPARAPHHCGGWVLMLGITCGKRSWNAATAVWSNMKPVCAASWWARTTSVRGAPGSPSRATRLTVVCSRRIARRRTRGPFWISSTKPASATAESAPPSTRRPASVSAAPAAPSALRRRGVRREGAPARLVLERDLLDAGRSGAARPATPPPRARRASRAGARSPPGARSPREACPPAGPGCRRRRCRLRVHGRATLASAPQRAERPGTVAMRRSGTLGVAGYASTGSAAPISVCALLSRPRIRNSVAITPSRPMPAPTMNASA